MEKLNTRMTRAELRDRANGLENQLNLTQENSRLKDQVASVQPAMVPAERTKRHKRGAGNAALIAVGIGLAAAVGIGGALLVDANQPGPSTPRSSDAAGQGDPNGTTILGASPSAAETFQLVLSLTNPASKDTGGNWIVKNPDGKAETVSPVDGFTPDTALVLAPQYGKTLPIEPATFADFQKSLNDPKHPLVGYTYGENDQSDNLNYKRTLQVPMYSWTVVTGLEVDAPGIGHLVGGKGRAVELMIMNIDGSVGDFGSDKPILIKDGFTGTGRIWDAENVIEDERGISSHYVNRLQTGVTGPGESGFIGQCNIATNCDQVLLVSVIRTQWGKSADGTPRYQYQLLREEIVNK